MSQLLELHVAGEVYREKVEESLTTYLKQQSQIAKVLEASSAELASILSGRLDLNQRPLAPQASALSELRHAPMDSEPVLPAIISRQEVSVKLKVALTSAELGLSFSPEADVKLVHLIQPNRVFLNLEAKNLEEAIRLLVPLVVRDKPQVDQMRLIAEVLGRERLVSTIVGRGFALPHARSDEVSELTIGVGIFPEGLENPTPDGKPVKAVFLLLEPKRVSKLYLKTLGVLARLARMEGILSKLVSAKNPDQYIETIKETDLVVTERLCAGDIARSIEPARLGMSVKQVADLFFRNETLSLGVVDEKDKVVGIVRCSDLLGAAMPEYARMIGGLRFLSEFEPFDRFLHEEDRMPVDSVMTRDFIQVEETASIVEVTSLLLHQKENALVVTKEASYLGMISLRDIITKVMRT